MLYGSQLTDADRARVESCAGRHAGAWLCVLPVVPALRALPGVFRLALCVRLGVALPELQPLSAGGVVCGACGAMHDAFGRHPSVCSRGNSEHLWTERHDVLQDALIWVARVVGQARARAVGRTQWFSYAALAAAGRLPAADAEGRLRGGLFADIVLPGYRGPGRHLFVDVAVTAPDSLTAVAAGAARCGGGGAAAQARASKKHAKYGDACAAMGADFRAACMDRYGACCDDLHGLVQQLCGDGDRSVDSDDWYYTAPSRVSYHMQRVVFACVMADAAMLSRVIDRDVVSQVREALPGHDWVGAGRRRARAG